MLRFVLVCLLLVSSSAMAEVQRYTLDARNSTVQFTYRLNGAPVTGTMPIETAQIGIDFANIRNTTADVTLRADRAKAGVVFATEAMRSATVLDTKRHPRIRFRSTKASQSSARATVDGALTVRGSTQPIRLTARFAETAGAAPGDRDRLTVLLTGQISRAAFGATGYGNLVGDPIDLRIRADLRRVQ